MAATAVTTVTFTRKGLTWRVPAGDPHIGFGLFVEGGFGQDRIDALLGWLDAQGRVLDPGDVFVDIGANIGSTSIPVVRARGCRALAIEPVQATYDLLRENVELNGLGASFMFVNAAIVASSSRVVMETGENIGAAAVRPASESTSSATSGGALTTAAGLSLGDALAVAGVTPSQVALVWADVQGCETAVIDTGADLWARGVPLWAEFEPGLLALHGGVDGFFDAARTHFDHFIEAHDLLRAGPAAVPQPIDRLTDTLSRVPLQTDVLLLSQGQAPSQRRNFLKANAPARWTTL